MRSSSIQRHRNWRSVFSPCPISSVLFVYFYSRFRDSNSVPLFMSHKEMSLLPVLNHTWLSYQLTKKTLYSFRCGRAIALALTESSLEDIMWVGNRLACLRSASSYWKQWEQTRYLPRWTRLLRIQRNTIVPWRSCCGSSLLTALPVHSTDQRKNTCHKFPPGGCFVPTRHYAQLLSKFRLAVGLRFGLIILAYQLYQG